MKVIQMEPVYEGGQAVLLARITDDDATPLLIAEISSITLKCYDQTDPVNPVKEETLTVASVIYDTLQTGNGWTVDSTGWNFRFKTGNDYFPIGKRTYVLELKVTELGGDITYQTWEQPTLNLFQR